MAGVALAGFLVGIMVMWLWTKHAATHRDSSSDKLWQNKE
jgi:hypothetical protein